MAQDAHRTTFNVSAALGGGSMGFSALVGASLRSERWMMTLRTTGNLPPGGKAVATDFALLASRVVARPRAMFAFGAGVALTETGDSSRTYGQPFNAHTGVGLPLQASAMWRPAQGFGLGVTGVANLNNRRSFWSVLLGFQLGRFD